VSPAPTPSRPQLPRGYESDQTTGAHGELVPFDQPLLARFGAAYEAKYEWPLSGEDLDPA
jgi:hypothetical protein